MQEADYKDKMIRHGEMLLVPVDEVPEGFGQVFEGREYIVAHSETGHHHVAVGEVAVYRPVGGDSADIYLKAVKESVIEHHKTFDKHETKTITPGLYLCRAKTEYDPFARIIQQVRD